MNIKTHRRDALRWIAEREPIKLFPMSGGGATLAMAKTLARDGYVEEIRAPEGRVGLSTSLRWT